MAWVIIAGENLRLSSGYLVEFDEEHGDGQTEALGISTYLLAHIYQQVLPETPYWMTSGKADTVRLYSNLLDSDGASKGGHWSDGSRTAAYFFAWLEQSYPEFLYNLNQRMTPENGNYSDELFREITGSDLPSLWESYQASF